MNSITHVSTVGTFVRFAIVGIVSNAVLFVLYLLVTQLGMGHKLAATLAYAAGVLQTFVFNRSWSFRDVGALRPACIRYVAAYGFGYLSQHARPGLARRSRRLSASVGSGRNDPGAGRYAVSYAEALGLS